MDIYSFMFVELENEVQEKSHKLHFQAIYTLYAATLLLRVPERIPYINNWILVTRSLTRNGCKSYFSKKHVAMAWLTVIMAKNEHAVMKCV